MLNLGNVKQTSSSFQYKENNDVYTSEMRETSRFLARFHSTLIYALNLRSLKSNKDLALLSVILSEITVKKTWSWRSQR